MKFVLLVLLAFAGLASADSAADSQALEALSGSGVSFSSPYQNHINFCTVLYELNNFDCNKLIESWVKSALGCLRTALKLPNNKEIVGKIFKSFPESCEYSLTMPEIPGFGSVSFFAQCNDDLNGIDAGVAFDDDAIVGAAIKAAKERLEKIKFLQEAGKLVSDCIGVWAIVPCCGVIKLEDIFKHYCEPSFIHEDRIEQCSKHPDGALELAGAEPTKAEPTKEDEMALMSEFLLDDIQLEIVQEAGTELELGTQQGTCGEGSKACCCYGSACSGTNWGVGRCYGWNYIKSPKCPFPPCYWEMPKSEKCCPWYVPDPPPGPPAPPYNPGGGLDSRCCQESKEGCCDEGNCKCACNDLCSEAAKVCQGAGDGPPSEGACDKSCCADTGDIDCGSQGDRSKLCAILSGGCAQCCNKCLTQDCFKSDAEVRQMGSDACKALGRGWRLYSQGTCKAPEMSFTGSDWCSKMTWYLKGNGRECGAEQCGPVKKQMRSGAWSCSLQRKGAEKCQDVGDGECYGRVMCKKRISRWQFDEKAADHECSGYPVGGCPCSIGGSGMDYCTQKRRRKGRASAIELFEEAMGVGLSVGSGGGAPDGCPTSTCTAGQVQTCKLCFDDDA